jgi:hypothetical protein
MVNEFHYLYIDGQILSGTCGTVNMDKDPNIMGYWKVNVCDAISMYDMIIEALGLANIDQIYTTITDIKVYAYDWDIVLDGESLLQYMLETKPTYFLRRGANRFIKYVLNVDPDEFWNWVSNQGETPDYATMPVYKGVVINA